MEVYGCYEMIFVDAHVRYEQSQNWVSLRLQPEESGQSLKLQWVAGRTARVACLGAAHILEDNTAWYCQEKDLWFNLSSLTYLCLSHTTETLTPEKKNVSYIFL